MSDPKSAAMTRLASGQRVSCVLKNPKGLLAIVLENGVEIIVKWVDKNGQTIPGEPVIESVGHRINTSSLHELEGLRPHGVARRFDPNEPALLQRQRFISALQQPLLPSNYRF